MENIKNELGHKREKVDTSKIQVRIQSVKSYSTHVYLIFSGGNQSPPVVTESKVETSKAGLCTGTCPCTGSRVNNNNDFNKNFNSEKVCMHIF